MMSTTMMLTMAIIVTMLTMTIQVGDWFHDQVPHRSRHPCGAGDLCCPWTAMIIVIIIIVIIILILIATTRLVTWMQTTGSGVAQKTWIWEGRLTQSSSPRNTNINTNRYVHTLYDQLPDPNDQASSVYRPRQPRIRSRKVFLHKTGSGWI